MDRRQRLAILSEAAGLDRDPATNLVGARRLRFAGGAHTTLMRVMQTNACSLSCGYCPTFCGGKVRRAALSAEEVARTFMEAHRAGLVDGLFLTSGVPGRPERATDRMLAAVELLRRREGFAGYVHLKLLPGAEAAQVEAAAKLATRVSINLEAPGDRYVAALAPEKRFGGDLLPKLELAGRLLREARARARPGAPPANAGTTTQFVVGAAGEPDRDILAVVARLEAADLLHHAHFSAFQPVAGTPMEDRAATPAMREYRLYQAEHLLRRYGFGFDELPFDAEGNLPLDDDPKTAWALRHPERFPVAVERADYDELVRVPGVGPKAASIIVRERRRTAIPDAGGLRRMGVDTARAGWFITLRGRRLAGAPPARQLRLFAHGEHLPQGPWKTDTPPCAYR
jgi:predicted DNA-binding helix-hairpin-helix protein